MPLLWSERALQPARGLKSFAGAAVSIIMDTEQKEEIAAAMCSVSEGLDSLKVAFENDPSVASIISGLAQAFEAVCQVATEDWDNPN